MAKLLPDDEIFNIYNMKWHWAETQGTLKWQEKKNARYDFGIFNLKYPIIGYKYYLCIYLFVWPLHRR